MTDKATRLEAAPCARTVVGTQRPPPSTAPPSRALPRVKCAYRRSRSPSTNEGVTAWCPFLQRSFPLITDLPLSRARPSVSQNPAFLRLHFAWLMFVNSPIYINNKDSLKKASHKSTSQFCKVGEYTRQERYGFTVTLVASASFSLFSRFSTPLCCVVGGAMPSRRSGRRSRKVL